MPVWAWVVVAIAAVLILVALFALFRPTVRRRVVVRRPWGRRRLAGRRW
jgi:hypothetical protein